MESRYLVDNQCVDFKVAILTYMESCKGLVISNSQRRESLVEVYVKPVDAKV